MNEESESIVINLVILPIDVKTALLDECKKINRLGIGAIYTSFVKREERNEFIELNRIIKTI